MYQWYSVTDPAVQTPHLCPLPIGIGLGVSPCTGGHDRRTRLGIVFANSIGMTKLTRPHPVTAARRLAAFFLISTSFAACTDQAFDPEFTGSTGEVSLAIVDPNDTSPIEPPPRAFHFHALTSSTINYSFTCGAHATHHDVLRRSGDGTVVNVAYLSICPGQFFLQDNQVQPGTEYCYWVIGSNSEQAAASDESCITSPLDFDAPALPAGAVVDVTQTSATLRFTDTATNEGGFRISFQSGNGPFTLVQTFLRADRADRGTGDVFTVPRTGLTRDTAYAFNVEVFHDFAPVAAQQLFRFTTLPDLPTTPGNFRVTGKTSTTLSLAWTDALYESNYFLSKTAGIGQLDRVIPANSTSITLSDLYPSSRYCFKLRAQNRAGNAETTEVCDTTLSGPQAFDIFLSPDPPLTGILSFVGRVGPLTNFVLNSLEVRAAANHPQMTTFTFIPPGAPGEACLDPSRRVVVAIGGSLTGAGMTKIYGSTTLSITNGVFIRGCAGPDTLPVTIRPIITAHTTTP